MNSIQTIQKEIAALDAKVESGKITDSEVEYLTILTTCEGLLARTRKAGGAGRQNRIHDTLFSLATGRGTIDFRQLFKEMLKLRKYGPGRITQKEISEGTGVSVSNISSYMNNHTDMYVATYNKVLNYILTH